MANLSHDEFNLYANCWVFCKFTLRYYTDIMLSAYENVLLAILQIV